jgi:hypothetical protein
MFGDSIPRDVNEMPVMTADFNFYATIANPQCSVCHGLGMVTTDDDSNTCKPCPACVCAAQDKTILLFEPDGDYILITGLGEFYGDTPRQAYSQYHEALRCRAEHARKCPTDRALIGK